MTPPNIPIEPLTREGFARFGDVVDVAAATGLMVNQGYARRFDDLTPIDVAAEGGAVQICLFEAQPRPAPISIEVMERHPLGTQLFMPLQDRPWLVVVCGDPATSASYRAFLASGRQGVNYARNVWHHPLLVLDRGSRFIVVDRKGPGNNLDEVLLTDAGTGKLRLAPLPPGIETTRSR